MPSRLEDLREPRAERFLAAGSCLGQPQADNRGCPGADAQPVMRGGLGLGVVWVDRIVLAADDPIVDPVLDVRRRIGGAEQALVVGFVFGDVFVEYAKATPTDLLVEITLCNRALLVRPNFLISI